MQVNRKMRRAMNQGSIPFTRSTEGTGVEIDRKLSLTG
jgi:hypothetical protein